MKGGWTGLGRACATSALLVGACASAGCRATWELRAAAAEAPTPRGVVMFFVDGMDRDTTRGLLDAGRLPNIERLFVRGGVCVEHAVAALPAVTYANTSSLLTGRWPSRHGILGNVWFDRESLSFRNYSALTKFRKVNEHLAAATIFELLSDRLTVNVLCHTDRGATRSFHGLVTAGMPWLLRDFRGVDARVGASAAQVGAFARERGEWPAFWLNYFPGVDEVGHHDGPASKAYRDAIVNADAQIGRVDTAVRASPLAGQAYYVLVSDHGHVQSPRDRRMDLTEWLRREHRRKVCYETGRDLDLTQRALEFNECDAVVLVNANRTAAIHLRGRQSWFEAPTRETRERIACGVPGAEAGLVDVPAVGLVCYSIGAGVVRVHAGSRVCVVERDAAVDGEARYRLYDRATSAHADVRDALGYRVDGQLAAFIDAGWHTGREWLAATAGTRYPDFVPQIVELFDSPRAGDVVVFAADDWSFDREQPGGHGAALASDMRIWLSFSGPDLPAGTSLPTARIVDVVPTMLELLGESECLRTAGPFDGVSLAGPLRAAGLRAVADGNP
ncbi:MAG: alkaline phosphatase family protein [Phycisphaerae bacterium]